MSEGAVNFLRLGLDKDDILQAVDNYILSPYVTSFPSATNIVSEIYLLPFSETISDMDKAVKISERWPMLQPEQSLVALISHIVRKRTRSGAMVLDKCMETVASAPVCLLEQGHRKFTSFDSD